MGNRFFYLFIHQANIFEISGREICLALKKCDNNYGATPPQGQRGGGVEEEEDEAKLVE